MISLSHVITYCNEYEKIENYQEALLDETQVWECHHRLEISPTGKHFSIDYLKKQGLYYNQKPESLIFMTKSEHRKIHNKNPDKRRKISESHKGKVAWNKGKNVSDETRKRISEARKGRHWKLVNGKRVYY